MKKVLFVGEHMLSKVGNGNMLAAVLSQVNKEKYQVACFCSHDVDPIKTVFDPMPFTVINATTPKDFWGNERLVSIVQRVDLDILCFVGIDIWRYQLIWNRIIQLRDHKKFKIIFIFPYDVQHLRLDWAKLAATCDLPCVYSQYGIKMLKERVPHLTYFKPPLFNKHLFKPQDKALVRKKVFSGVAADKIIFGFVGQNQVRKSPERLLKAYFEAKRENPNILLYLHTDLEGGVYNLKQIAKDYGAISGDLIQKTQGFKYPVEQMVHVYNAMDCLVNCTIQEGLSWTPLEAMACGTPVIASDTTSQTELVIGAAEMVPCNDLAFVPLMTEGGKSEVESRACKVRDIKDTILRVAADPDLRKQMSEKGIERAKNWLEGVGNVNDLFDSVDKIKPAAKINKVLFAQHSSAGDVLMATQCFKGIKERHPKLPLVYMTQRIYQDIIEGNPYIDEIIDWDTQSLGQYQVVYNPHGEHILEGGFNNLDVTLHSMYPYFCKVDADDLSIVPKEPSIFNFADDYNEDERYVEYPGDHNYIVVHTTGGNAKYRSYPHMDVALKGIGLPVIQIGGPSDIRCKSDLDLCGKLTWRESAWVMAHAKAAVVIDSFLSHLAGAVGTDAVVLYGPAPPRVVQPKAQGCKIINLKPDMLKVCSKMTHCWGENPQCNSPCIHTISPMVVKKALKELL